MFGSSMQGARLQKMIGQLQNPGLQKVVEQVNTTFGSKGNRDTVELSKKSTSTFRC